MAELSRELLMGAIMAYLVAMMLYAAEFVIGVGTPAGGFAALRSGSGSRSRSLELVGAGLATASGRTPGPANDLGAGGPGANDLGAGGSGADGPVTGRPMPADDVVSPVSPAVPESRWVSIVGRLAVVATALGAAAHAGGLVTRGLAAHRVPWGNMYEFIIAVTLVASIAWVGLALRRPAVRPLGLFVTLVMVLLLGLDLIVLRTAVEPLVPALNSYWLKIHVTLAITASGLFMVAAAAAVMHLIRAGYDVRVAEDRPVGFPFSLGERLPSAANLERLTFRLHAFTFPIWTLAITCGAIWAEAAWGRYWGWDPKETWSFVAWVIYAGYLHARATPSVKRTAATWLAVAGWIAMLVNLFAVNIVVHGLHSYAGVG